LERALEINPAFTPALYVLGFTLADQVGLIGKKTERHPAKRHWTAPLGL
jgi:hypothetical protein